MARFFTNAAGDIRANAAPAPRVVVEALHGWEAALPAGSALAAPTITHAHAHKTSRTHTHTHTHTHQNPHAHPVDVSMLFSMPSFSQKSRQPQLLPDVPRLRHL